MRWTEDPARVRPMLATLAEPPLQGPGLLFEPKYDGIRALVSVEPAKGGARVRLWSRLGNEKTTQFPSIVRALEKWGARLPAPVLLDGEIVALDAQGRPTGFQKLQGRIHLRDARDVEGIESTQPVALIAFDILRDGADDVRGLPLSERRARLQARLRSLPRRSLGEGGIRLSEQVADDGRPLHKRATSEGWEGLIVKEARAPYQSGRRSPTWRKLKVVNEQEFVVGGWTEPRQSRQYFGALLLGVPASAKAPARSRRSATREGGHEDKSPGTLKYVGHTGTGFDQAELARVWKLLKVREMKQSPFSARIKT